MKVFCDLGATNTRITTSANLADISYFSTPKDEEGISKLLIEEIGKIDNISAIYLAVCGLVDKESVFLPNLGISNYQLKKVLTDHFQTEVKIINDANSALIYEAFYHQKDPLLYLTLSSGIGGAFYFNKTVYTGKNGASLEVGKLQFDTYNYEQLCGGIGFNDRYNLSLKKMLENKEEYVKLYQKWIDNLSSLVANLIFIFDCPIVIGGGIVKSEQYFFFDLCNKVKQIVGANFQVDITISQRQDNVLLGLSLLE